MVIVGSLFALNYIISPFVIGIPRLEDWLRPREEVPFSASAWSTETFESGLRYPMAQYLISKEKLIGLSKEKIIEQLGKQNYHSTNLNYEVLLYELAPQDMYPADSWLFPKRLLNIGSWMLVIEIKNGVAMSCRIDGS